eukprot:scaffold3832_cov36-Cyclotella_meneghiniana.AAC.1
MPHKSRYGRAIAYLSSPRKAVQAFSPRLTRSKARQMVSRNHADEPATDETPSTHMACYSSSDWSVL